MDTTIQNMFLKLQLLSFGSLQREKFLSCYLGKSVFIPAAERNITD